MKRNENSKIEIVIKGSEENKAIVFEELVKNIESSVLRDIIFNMEDDILIKLAKCIHGATYKIIKGE